MPRIQWLPARRECDHPGCDPVARTAANGHPYVTRSACGRFALCEEEAGLYSARADGGPWELVGGRAEAVAWCEARLVPDELMAGG